MEIPRLIISLCKVLFQYHLTLYQLSPNPWENLQYQQQILIFSKASTIDAILHLLKELYRIIFTKYVYHLMF